MTSLLPEFSHPPVYEMVLSAQFMPLSTMHVAHLGLLWQDLRDAYPITEEHPPIDASLEQLDIRQAEPAPQIQLVTTLPFPRVWYLNEDGSELIQVQQDRLVHNWRQVEGREIYPRYDRLIGMFEREIDTFNRFVEREQLGSVTPTQYEVTYINHVTNKHIDNPPANLEKIVTLWSANYGDPFELKSEGTEFAARYALHDGDGNRFGGLYISANPAIRKADGEIILQLTLTARGRVDDQDFSSMRQFMDNAHDTLVRSFAAITTPLMHEAWGRLDAR